MTRSPVFICLSIGLALLAARAVGQDAVDQARRTALTDLKSGNLIRVFCADYGPVGGKFLKSQSDTLYIGVDEDVVSGKKPSRRIMRKGRSSYDRAPVWRSVAEPTGVAFSSVKEIHFRGRSTKTGAIVGGIILGGGGLVLGAIITAMDSEGSQSSDILSLTAGGLMVGALLGAAVGAMIPDWKLRYREPGFQADINLKPVLPVSTDRRLSNAATLYAGIQLTW